MHIDAVGLAGSENATTGLGGNYVSLDHNVGGTVDSILHSGAGPLPHFDGDITLTTDASHLLPGFSSSDATLLGNAGIDAVYLDASSSVSGGAFDLGNFGSTLGGGFESLHTAAMDLHTASVELELDVGNTVDGANHLAAGQSTVHISDANAASLLSNGLSFAEHNHVTLDAAGHDINVASTHLTNSLKDLQKLHIDQVHLSGDSTVNFDSHNTFTSDSLRATLASSLPIFDHDANVVLDFGDSKTLSEELDILASVTGATAKFESIGIDEFHGTTNLSASDNADWSHIMSDISSIHGVDTAARFEIGLADHSGALQNLDAELSGLSGFTTPDHFGSLISTLQGIGVNDFQIESGNVEISDDLTSALADSGMLHALPGADIVLDASNEVVHGGTRNSYVHLSTNLNTMAALNVDSVDVGAANKVYLDIQDLGLPTGDKTAMDEIRDLLRSLDPAGDAKWINGGYDSHQPESVSLVMSSNLLEQIANSFDILENHTSAADFSHQLSELGINNIAVRLDNGLDGDATIEAKASANAAIEKLFNPADHTYVPPTVTVIGETDPLHDILDPTKLHK